MARTETAGRQQASQQPQREPTSNLPAAQSNERAKPAIVRFKESMDARMAELQFALPAHISPERFQRVALTALQRKPELLKCTQQSLWNACLLAAQDGLMPDGREGAIVPYGENANGKRQADIATWMPMIEGLRKKARNSGEISNWEAHLVREKDHFEVILGDTPRIDHKPYFGAEDPGHIIGAYSIAWLKDGTISRDVMTKRDLDKIRAKSKAANGPWQDPAFEGEMYKKTVARRHYKQLPHSSDLDDMIRRDDEAFGLEDRTEDQIEQRQVRRVANTAAAFDQFAGNGNQAFIEHQSDDPEPQGERTQIDGDGEFDDDDVGTTEVNSATDQHQAETSKSAEASKSEATGHSEVEQQRAEPQQQTQAEQTTANDGKPAAKFDPHVGEEVRRWPPGAVPSDPDEYEFYVETKLSDYTRETADKIPDWWKSAEEKKLREACGISKQRHDELRNKAASRKTELLKG